MKRMRKLKLKKKQREAKAEFIFLKGKNFKRIDSAKRPRGQGYWAIMILLP